MRKADIGGFVNAYALAAATFSYTPQSDRAGRIVRVCVDNVSANDTWRLRVGGREVMTFRLLTVGNQRLLLVPNEASRWHPNWFDWINQNVNPNYAVPVPWGLTATLASDGGATADILFVVDECDPTDIQATEINHYRGTSFIIPITMSLAASQALPGVVAFDTQFAPPWVPSILGGAGGPSFIQAGYEVDILGVFLEGGGVNTFSGAANHQSTTKDVQIKRDGELLFTHSASDGLADQGNAAAAGSANTVFGQRSSLFPPFEGASQVDHSLFDLPVVYGPTHNILHQLELTGDLTGGASYANFLQVLIAKVTLPQIA